MTYHALVVDDSPDVLEDVKDRLESIGHTCDCVTCLQHAREHLAKSSYTYVLLDLEIPVRYGRPSRIANGQNLLREVRTLKGYADIPIIVMTSHGHDSPDLAVEVLRCDGATDFVKKTFADSGHTLEKAIQDALTVSGRSRPGAAKRSGAPMDEPPQQFECGEMVFSSTRVELCEVKICGGPESGMIRRILNELRHINQHGRFVRYDGNELAQRVGCDRGQNGVAEAVRDFRNSVCEVMLEEANVRLDRLHDVILNDRRYGYRLSSKITVRHADDPVNDPQNANDDVVNEPQNDVVNHVGDIENNPRQQWALERMQAGDEFRKADLVNRFKCSATTAERDLRSLRRRGMIEFIGPAKTGHWRLSSGVKR